MFFSKDVPKENCRIVQINLDMKKIHELHNHPMTEYRENIPEDKVLVDKEFGWLFSQIWEYWDDNHVIVPRSEFDKLKNY